MYNLLNNLYLNELLYVPIYLSIYLFSVRSVKRSLFKYIFQSALKLLTFPTFPRKCKMSSHFLL